MFSVLCRGPSSSPLISPIFPGAFVFSNKRKNLCGRERRWGINKILVDVLCFADSVISYHAKLILLRLVRVRVTVTSGPVGVGVGGLNPCLGIGLGVPLGVRDVDCSQPLIFSCFFFFDRWTRGKERRVNFALWTVYSRWCLYTVIFLAEGKPSPHVCCRNVTFYDPLAILRLCDKVQAVGSYRARKMAAHTPLRDRSCVTSMQICLLFASASIS